MTQFLIIQIVGVAAVCAIWFAGLVVAVGSTGESWHYSKTWEKILTVLWIIMTALGVLALFLSLPGGYPWQNAR